MPAGIHVGVILGGLATFGVILWLHNHRRGGAPRALGGSSPLRAWIPVLLLILGGTGIKTIASFSTLSLFSAETAAGNVDGSLPGRLGTTTSDREGQPPRLPASPQAGLSSPPTGTGSQPRRPFLHSQHEVVTCSTCHGTGEAHRVTRIQTARDCAACHHDGATLRQYECANCHGPTDMPGPLRVEATLDISAWIAPRARELPFDHVRHTDRVCQDCHTGPVLLTVETECAACHDDHHRPEAECSSCHVPAAQDAHDVQVHLTCTTSGCHSETRVPDHRPELSRPLCLMCHEEQRDHEPDGDCAACHMIPARPVQVSSSRAGRLRRGSGS